MAKPGDMIEYLNKNIVSYEIIEHAHISTAYDTTAVSNKPERNHAKTLVVETGNKYCMIVVPADRYSDKNLLLKTIKAEKLRLAQEDELKPFFPNYKSGTMPPFGNLFALPIYIEKSLTDAEEIVFDACSETKSIRLKMDDYMKLAKPIVAEFSQSEVINEIK
ncbi:MAG: YbaK/EbsC family protein [Bacteroidetes bacterium]|nr:YbaK/EbsC family protein [Bacteroidota bacterium]